MNTRDFSDALTDLERNLTLVMEFTDSKTLADFESDFRTQYAVIRALEICGEAVKRIPDDVRKLEPDIPWKAMAGMRDRLIHGYDNVNTSLVWTTVTKTVPSVLASLQALKSRIRSGPNPPETASP